jgi:hypothetical protein
MPGFTLLSKGFCTAESCPRRLTTDDRSTAAESRPYVALALPGWRLVCAAQSPSAQSSAVAMTLQAIIIRADGICRNRATPPVIITALRRRVRLDNREVFAARAVGCLKGRIRTAPAPEGGGDAPDVDQLIAISPGPHVQQLIARRCSRLGIRELIVTARRACVWRWRRYEGKKPSRC